MYKLCLLCGSKFEAIGHRLYCGEACQNNSKKKHAREQWLINKFKHIKHPDMYNKEKQCAICSKTFKADIRHPNQRTCSKKCKVKATYEKNKKLKYILLEKKCIICGKSFLPDRNYPQINSCSLKCGRKVSYGKHKQLKYILKERICSLCNRSFMPDRNHPLAKCCSAKCRNKFWAKRNYEKSKKINLEKSKRYRLKYPEKIKEYTKRLVESGKANINAKRWRERNLDRAKELHKKQYWKHRDKVLDYAKRYRQTEAGKISHRASEKNRQFKEKSKLIIDFSVTRIIQDKIRQRDNDLCVYCHKKPDEITFDHMIAQENKGSNSINNLVVACMSCNGSKRDMFLEEWLKSEYCKLNKITKESINPVVFELLNKQREQKRLN